MKKQMESLIFTLKIMFNCNKILFLFVIILSSIISFSPIISLMVTQNILNTIQSLIVPFSEVVFLILLYGIFAIVTTVMQSLYAYFNNQFSIILTYKMNYMIMDKCGKLSLEKLEETNTYEMINRLESEISNKPYQALNALIALISTGISFVFALIMLLQWKMELFLIFIIISVVSFILHLKVANSEFQMKFNRSAEERKVWYYSFLLTRDTAFKEVKILNLKDYFLNRYWKLVEKFISMDNQVNRMQIIINLGISILQDILAIVVMFIAIRETYLGIILIGTAVLYMNMGMLVQSTTSTLASSIHALYNSNLYMTLLKDFFDVEENEYFGNKEIDRIEQVSVKNLNYQYSANKQVLSNINFELRKGERIAIVGENGSGKSTLLKLLCGLYQPLSGEIKINGINLRDISTESYKEKISVLFQDFLKLEASLLSNVHLGHIEKAILKEEIEEALESADVGFLKENGEYLYDNFLGSWFEDGSQLSGGEWQKIALARVYYKKAEMYILDEPSSALDVLSEMNIFKAFFEKSKNEIGVFITHRVKIAKQADKIIVLKEGEVVDIGTHDYLYKHCELYRNLLLKEQTLDYSASILEVKEA